MSDREYYLRLAAWVVARLRGFQADENISADVERYTEEARAFVEGKESSEAGG